MKDKKGRKEKEGRREGGEENSTALSRQSELVNFCTVSLPQIRAMLLICFLIPDIWREQDFSQAHSKVNRKHLILLLLAALSNVRYAEFYLQITIGSLISTHQECHFFFPLVLTYALLTKTL